MGRLTPELRGRITGLVDAGMSFRAVGRAVGCDGKTVAKWMNRFRTTGNMKDLPRQGRPRVTSARQDASIVDRAINKRGLTSREIKKRVHRRRRQQRGQISYQTVRNRLHFVGLHSRKRTKKPRRLPVHKVNRLRFARQYRRWNRQNWKNVLFTDETSIRLRRIDGRRRVWRALGEELESDCVQEVEAYGGGSLMVWGGISEEGRTDLVVIQGGITAQRYIDDILRQEVVPYAGAVGEGFQLLDDNATAHRARITETFLREEGIDRIMLPSKSPDLNPIEPLWDQLKTRVDKKVKDTSTLGDLERYIRRAWNEIPQDNIRRLIRSMRRRCLAVLNNNGSHTRY